MYKSSADRSAGGVGEVARLLRGGHEDAGMRAEILVESRRSRLARAGDEEVRFPHALLGRHRLLCVLLVIVRRWPPQPGESARGERTLRVFGSLP